VEDVLSNHDQVESFTRDQGIVFTIRREGRKPTVVAVLVDIYTIGLADVVEAIRRFPEMTCLVTNGNWNSYTSEAKRYGYERQIGVFNTSEFFGALRRRESHKYIPKEARRSRKPKSVF